MYTHLLLISTVQISRAYCSFFYYNIFIASEQVFLRFFVSLCIGQSFGTEITIVWIITSIITSTILAIATPPIPGGGLSCYTILFTQLGIPSAGIALVISIELLMDAFLTACNLAFLQTELVLSAKKLNLLDEAKLRK